jgi:hypothetical protein
MKFNDLIFVTAQPDVPYFHWQTEVYVNNFIDCGINPNNIHIIYSIHKNRVPSNQSYKLKDLGVHIHHYVDEREQKHYIPSIKPFLISKWLGQYPQFGKSFFLHDADIIFRVLPDFNKLMNDDINYLSDTIGYIGYEYINDCCKRYESVYSGCGEQQLLTEMCDIVGIDVDVVKENQLNSGGGQYIIKNTDYMLWDKIYKDSTNLYNQMLDFQNRYPINPGQIQFWTAEMWSLLWNLWLNGDVTKVVDDLNFSWATDTIDVYNSRPILHMAGVTDNLKTTKFYKGEYINVNPLDELRKNVNHFDYIEENSATRKYIDIMLNIIKKDEIDIYK